jgi:long-chain fatty acid transport protein
MSIFGLKKFLPAAVMVAAVAALPMQQAQATNGKIPHGFGVQSKGMAGAGGTTIVHDTQSGASNPAGMVLLGNRFDVEAEFFAPIRDFTASANGPLTPGKTKSDSEFFLIPQMGANWMIDDKSSIGVTMSAAGGMNTDYPAAVFAGFGAGKAPTGVDLAQLTIGVTYAREFMPGQRFGISPVLAVTLQGRGASGVPGRLAEARIGH